jgi:glycosyltransferase involved in cell wall biosynthesis
MISILIPIYNGIEFINESVQSVILQSYTEWELLIGINGHPQNSFVFNIAKKYEKIDNRIKVYDFYTIKGKSNTLNELIKHSKYNYIALLDIDDIWHYKKLEIQSIFLPYFDIVGSNCVWFGNYKDIAPPLSLNISNYNFLKDNLIISLRIIIKKLLHSLFPSYFNISDTNLLQFGHYKGIVPPIPLLNISNYDFVKVNPIINSSSVIKKELCYWNPKFDGVEDYDLWIRLRKQNKLFYNCPEIFVKHRIHKQSAFNAKGNNNKVNHLLNIHGLRNQKLNSNLAPLRGT